MTYESYSENQGINTESISASALESIGLGVRSNKMTREEAGRKGGIKVSQNRSHMAEIGRRGGIARGARARVRAALRTQDSPRQ